MNLRPSIIKDRGFLLSLITSVLLLRTTSFHPGTMEFGVVINEP